MKSNYCNEKHSVINKISIHKESKDFFMTIENLGSIYCCIDNKQVVEERHLNKCFPLGIIACGEGGPFIVGIRPKDSDYKISEYNDNYHP
jgi:hypothetical protein